MSFTCEDRKRVYDFLVNILDTHYNTEPVFYEYVRSHVPKAPEVVKQYIRKKCKGENLLEYFRKRKNYFEVEGTKISLRKQPRTQCFYSEDGSIKKRKIWKPKFNRRRNDDSISNASEDQVNTNDEPSNGVEKLEHEEYVYKHFIRLLEGNKVVEIKSIDFESLPKKVIRHLTLYCNKSVLNYFSKYPDVFTVDDNGNVSLSNEPKNINHPNLENGTNLVSEENEESIFINPDVQNAYIWLETIEFFLNILKRNKTPFIHIDRLAGYLTGADESVKVFLKSYKPFKTFFSEAPLVFFLRENEVSLSHCYSNVLHLARNRIRDSSKESNDSDSSLLDDLHDIFNLRHWPENEWTNEDLQSLWDTDSEEHPLEESDSKDLWGEDMFEIDYQSDKEESEDTMKEKQINDSEHNSSPTCSNYDKPTIPNNEADGNQTNDMEHSNLSTICSNDNQHDLKSTKTTNSDESDANFLKFLFTVELFCVETVETEIDFSSEYKIQAVEFFLNILKESCRKWTLTSLQGFLGQAPPNVISFINKLYKGDKFSSFFQEHEEFVFKSSLVNLAPNYRDTFLKRQDLFSKYRQEFCFVDLYEKDRYKTVLKETFALFFEVYQRLMNNKIKLNRLCNIIEHFPDCLEWIKSSSGKSLPEKIETFLKLVNFFEFSEEGFVSLPSEKHNDTLSKWLQQMYDAFKNSKLELPVFRFVRNDNNMGSRKLAYNCEKDCFWSLVEFFESIRNVMKDVNYSHYYELVGILPKELLFKIAEAHKDSRIIISALLKNGEFLIKNGRIILNDSKEQEDFVTPKSNVDIPSDVLSQTTVSKPQTTQTLNEHIIEQSVNGISDPDSQNQIIDSERENKVDFENAESLSKKDTLSKNCTVDDVPSDLIPHVAATVLESEDFDSEVSDSLSVEAVDKLSSISEDANSSISDVESDGNCEDSQLTILPINEDKSQSMASPLSSKIQSVVNNVPEPTRGTLVGNPSNVKDLCSENKVDDFVVGTSLPESFSSFHTDGYKESNEEVICERSDVPTQFENECVNTDQSEEISSNVEFKSIEKTTDINPPEIMNSESILEMKNQVNCLAREFFIKNRTLVKIFVATAKFVFDIERNDCFEGKNCNEIVENSSTFDHSLPRIRNTIPTSSKSPSLSCPVTKNLDSLKKSSDAKETNDASLEYPLQPLSAEIILLTADSCIAQAKIASGKQNIYFLKCVFSCEEKNCCSECFDALCVGDLVSCFVPISEISHKMWIPMMVSKEGSRNFSRMDEVNQMLRSQRENGFYRQCEVDIQLPCQKYNYVNSSVQTDCLCTEQESQTEIVVREVCCQTDLSGDVKKSFPLSEVMCQTSSVLVHDVSLQIGCATRSIDCQVDLSGINTNSFMCQTDLTGSVKECKSSGDSLCQTDVSGEIKVSTINADDSSQTISTGPIMVINYYHYD